MKLLLTNLVYGSTYTDLFLNYHLPSLLDKSNLPSVKKDTSIIIYTDSETGPILQKHPNMIRLLSLCEVEIHDFAWRPGASKFDLRYSALVQSFRTAAAEALKRGSLLSAWTADMVIAKDVLPKLFEKMDEGFDSIFLHPARCAAEAVIGRMNQTKSLTDKDQTQLDSIADSFLTDRSLYASDLWKLCQAHPHPYLTVANHWRATHFTHHPFYIHWSTATGTMTRSFATTPIIMRPTERMKTVTQVIDIEVPSWLTNPYWADDFDEFGFVQMEPTLCYNHALSLLPAQYNRVRAFAKERHPHQQETFRRKLYYPNRLVANIDNQNMYESDLVVEKILQDEIGVEKSVHKSSGRELGIECSP